MKIKKYTQWYVQYRVRNWLPYIGFLLFTTNSVNEVLKLSLVTSLMFSYAYSLNDFIDKDRPQKWYHPLIPLLFFFFLFHTLNFSQKMITLLFLLIVTTYSLPKIRLKKIPFLSTLLNSIGFSLIFVLPNISITSIQKIILLNIFFINTVAQLLHEKEDSEEDKKNQIKTTYNLIGDVKTKKIILFLFMLIQLINLLNQKSYIFFFINLTQLRPILKMSRKLYRKNSIKMGVLYLILNFLYS